MFCGCSRTFSSFCATRACLASAAHASRLWYWPVAASLSSPNMRPWQLQLHRSKHIQYMIPTIIQWYYCKCKLSLKVALKERASHDNNPAVSNISQHQGILKTWCHKCRRLSHPNQGLCRESAVFRCQVPHTLSRPHTQKAFKKRIRKHEMVEVPLSQNCRELQETQPDHFVNLSCFMMVYHAIMLHVSYHLSLLSWQTEPWVPWLQTLHFLGLLKRKNLSKCGTPKRKRGMKWKEIEA